MLKIAALLNTQQCNPHCTQYIHLVTTRDTYRLTILADIQIYVTFIYIHTQTQSQ